MKIAINGMGRIGRLLFRRLINHSNIEIVAVNDLMDTGNLCYLLKYDSVFGSADYPIEHTDGILINGKKIAAFNQPDAKQLPWEDLNVDVVLECTGKYSTKELASHHFEAGAKRVLLSTTGADNVPLLIYGFNQQKLKNENIVSPGGCMTNCSTHIINLMKDLGIESVHAHVIHSYTSRQELVDAPHKDFRRGRAAAESIIPVPVDLAQSLERLFPSMKNKIAAVTTRVPVANGAFADFTFHLTQKISTDEVNTIFKNAAEKKYKGIIQYTEEPVVSLDIKANPHSAIICGDLTSVVGKQVKVMAFFDNEYGYTSRMIDWLQYWNTAPAE
jgi:glyceraldehyde 3-phosphate dehydrogenase